MTLRAVTKDEFYAFIGPLDAIGSIQPTPWPYTTVYKLRYGGKELGRVVGKGGGAHDYFLNA